MGAQVKAIMCAFEEDLRERIIEIPDSKMEIWEKTSPMGKLEMVHDYGQNERQCRNCCSLSMGDLVWLNGELWLIQAIGFRKLDFGQALEWMLVPRRDKSFHKWVTDITE